ncbi:MAG TPA: OmpH family outer membrane protein [Bryobacteraceae bacterium]|nr:OmpH family outer membrane protein [Bryobacteraceae bacterium]
MKQIVTVLAVALAAAGIGAAQSKVGIVNLQRAISETAEIKKAIVDVTTKYRPRQQELEKLQADLAGIQQQLNGGKLAPGAEQQLRSEGTFKQRQLERKDQDLREDVDKERNEILSHASQRMQQVIQKIADERGLDVVIDASNTVFFKAGLDITDAAIAAYDKAYPVK